MVDRIEGQIERITYNDEDKGYGVVRVRIRGRRDLVTVVGSFVNIMPGEILSMEGEWTIHPRYGEQFKVDHYETLKPATLEGIRKYLGSGLIKGIGPVMADRIVNQFGKDTLDIIDREIERLAEIQGIGEYRIKQIGSAWEEQKEIRELMIFLRSHGVGAAHASRIFKQYGKASLTVLQENPYRLAMDISGIGFLTADKIARNLGFSADSSLRAEAALLYLLYEASDDGHVCVPEGQLVEQAEKLLEIPLVRTGEALRALVASERLVSEVLQGTVATHFGDRHALYLRGFHVAETQVAQRLSYLRLSPYRQHRLDPEKAVAWLQGKLPFELAPLQKQAVKQALSDQVVVITGGPGTGKTTLIRAILAVFKQISARVCLAAPTGRAAKRLSEATRHPAGTVHRLLEFSPQLGGFQRNEGRPLKADVIIIDEASMLDILLSHYLLKAIPGHAVLILVGDVDQLPSVGPGNVLNDIIESRTVSVVRLTEIFRQARQSRIIVNAHLVRNGQLPRTQNESDKLQDFYFIQKEDPEEAFNILLKLCTDRIPARFGFDPMEDVQVLSPMHRGAVGTQRLNQALQEALNPRAESVNRNGRVFRLQDRVMQVRNNYDKEVFNGDMGRIAQLDMENQEVKVLMDGRLVTYDFSELDELQLAYAISVHKAQGSEYQAVVLPLVTQHYVMLQRNLLYTAITRAKKLVVIVGSKKALAMAVRNNKMDRRFTLLRERLAGELS
ncbi:SF1B family DNA helicase RecD2 [Desulfoferrobacter suflitae]|uniref:SF1B family DNA helicase RecD2 n=1 Tax=Desulfoferrobacter suflitae TaxID=2865782 RepID=UPI002164B33F|nr:ATP-dependent RecD-like DNA helicase [Desulfoferrobacter suflitae]MCK8600563.1 ATP-dependent RecD-like DNA helicase [Desulfoferrobacter suflitae]